MKISGLIWIDEVIWKLSQKHRVRQEEVREIFASHPQFRFVEKGHRRGENVYAALGETGAGRRLVVFFIYKKDQRALILSARDMTQAERRRYGKS